MNKTPWKPWHQVVQLRDDLKSGELSLSIFAADLYDVIMGKAKPVYQNPEEFFARTYPTFNLRELVKDVIVRLAGKNDKAVRQLELTYGGGKTHTLITLLHLVSDPAKLPDLPAVKEFIEQAGMTPPKTRVAALAFDKLDVEKGMEIRDPQGKVRWLKQPWSVLAWQIAGAEGLKLLHAEGRDEERESAPAENLLSELLAIPGKHGLATLVLVDEVLMYARGKVGLDPAWRGRLQDFFQYLTQAVTKIDRCAMVASLLATDPTKSDQLGKQITQELYAIFRRQREEGVQPVVKEDVAEILRRQFFKPESIKDREGFRSHVVAAIKGISELDEQTKKDGKNAEDRYLRSYPFHPDLTEVFYSKWTNLEGFQRTRGVLRTLTLALRDAEKWDTSPLVTANVFLTAADREGISESLRELTSVAASEEYEGKRQEWTGILEGELGKARDIQRESSGLKFRELEQAVIATFLHSQPIGQKALTNELLVLLGHTRPDKIELEKALQRWTEVSWFLDEAAISEAAGPDGRKTLPKSWRLGSKPNLRQMHTNACTRVSPDLIEAKLLDAIGNLKTLTAGASAAGATVHNLPTKPSDIEDDGEFHYAVLGPKATSASGSPSAEAKRSLEETTAPDRPRVYRNAVVLAVPSRHGLDAARNCVRDYLGWEEVRVMLKNQEIDPLRAELLSAYVEAAKKKIPDTIQQAYCVVVTVSEKNEIQAFKVTISAENLFSVIKADARSRIQESVISADALLPGGPYNLWREGETSRRVKDLVGAFAQFPHLPKMLRRQEIIATLVDGAIQGFFVFRSTRPDRSVPTIWRQQPSEADLKDPSLEVVLPEAASLTDLACDLLAPGKLPGLWPSPPEVAVKDIVSYFAGGKVVKIPRDGYEDTVTVPKAERQVVELSITTAVEAGRLWLLSGPASILAEKIPAGILTDLAQLMPPPLPIPATDVLPQNLPEAWRGQETTALAVSAALSQKLARTLPWSVVKEAIDGAIRSRYLETTLDSAPWPCELSGAQTVRLCVATGKPEPPPPQPPPLQPGVRIAEAELKPNEVQDLADVMGELRAAAVGLNLKLSVRIQLSGDPPPSEAAVDKTNRILSAVSKGLLLR